MDGLHQVIPDQSILYESHFHDQTEIEIIKHFHSSNLNAFINKSAREYISIDTYKE